MFSGFVLEFMGRIRQKDIGRNGENEEYDDDMFLAQEREIDEVSIVNDLAGEEPEQRDMEFVTKLKTQNGSK